MSKKNIVNLMCLDLYFQIPRDASVIVQSEDKVSWQSFSTSWITFYGCDSSWHGFDSKVY